MVAQLEEAIRPLLEGTAIEAHDVVLEAPCGGEGLVEVGAAIQRRIMKATRRADSFVEQLHRPGG